MFCCRVLIVNVLVWTKDVMRHTAASRTSNISIRIAGNIRIAIVLVTMPGTDANEYGCDRICSYVFFFKDILLIVECRTILLAKCQLL